METVCSVVTWYRSKEAKQTLQSSALCAFLIGVGDADELCVSAGWSLPRQHVCAAHVGVEGGGQKHCAILLLARLHDGHQHPRHGTRGTIHLSP